MSAACLIAAGLYLTLLFLKAALAARYARDYPRPLERADFPNTTIVQPILGGDPALESMLAANLERLPGAQFLWLIDHDDVAGNEAARRALAAHPNAQVTILACPAVPDGVNPKVFKLARAEPLIATQDFVVLDDDTRLTRLGFSALLDALNDHDLATGLPHYLPGQSVPSRLVAQFVNNHGVLTYLPSLVFSQPLTINGMAWAMRTERLRALGGFTPLLRRLADDLAIARLVRSAGGRIRQTIFPHETATTVAGPVHYVGLMHRWFVFARLLLREQPLNMKSMIGVLHGLPPVLLWIVLVAGIASSGWSAFAPLVACLVVRAVTIAAVQRKHLGHAVHEPLWSLVSELLQPVHMAHALLSSKIRWRSRIIEVRGDDEFSLR